MSVQVSVYVCVCVWVCISVCVYIGTTSSLPIPLDDRGLDEDLWYLPLVRGAGGEVRKGCWASTPHELEVLCGYGWVIASTAMVRAAMFGIWNLKATLVLNHESYWVASKIQLNSQRHYSLKSWEVLRDLLLDLVGSLIPHWTIISNQHIQLEITREMQIKTIWGIASHQSE